MAPDWRSMGMGDMLGIVFFEMCAGVLMGLVCRMVYYALEIAGLRISTDSGLFVTLNFAGIEGIPQQAPSIILFLLASIMMVGMDLHYFIIKAVQASYQLLPIGGGAVPWRSNQSTGFNDWKCLRDGNTDLGSGDGNRLSCKLHHGVDGARRGSDQRLC